jgi:heterodisulfide reductase subunit C
MGKQIAFIVVLLVTLGVFSYTAMRIFHFFKLTKPFPINQFGKRFAMMMTVAIGQSKIFRHPLVGLMHALVFWGFMVITLGSLEMVIDGLTGYERSLRMLGLFYDIITASGDVFALIVLLMILGFLFRRLFMSIARFKGIEMKKRSKVDANVALTIILLLMVSLLGMNTYYIILQPDNHAGVYPVSQQLAGLIGPSVSQHLLHELFWWMHILFIFIFANLLPYSKHFHVFMSVPNVFLSRLEPLGYLRHMPSIEKEVRLMLNPETAYAAPAESPVVVERFGVKDVEDVTWKNYLDSLACTECGRCTSVCPANLTGKKLSPRKIIMDVRARMNQKGPGMIKSGKEFNDMKSLLHDYVSAEELWACTTCNACAQECPININHPSLIVDMRRYLVMEEAAAPASLNLMFTYIENNGAPWQYPAHERETWMAELDVKM